MTLRDYQTRTVTQARELVARGSRALCLVIPTGGGKTRTAAAICESAIARGNRVLWCAHRAELVDQAADTLAGLGLAVSVVRADDPRTNPDAPVTVASIPTLAARPGCRPEARIVVLDECHHVAAATWRAIAADYSGAVLLGLTATPERSDGSPLGDVFEEMVVGAQYSDLIRQGHLVDCDVIAPPRRLSSAVAQDPAEAYLEHGRGRPGLVFTATVAESVSCVERLRAAGIRAAHVDGQSTDRADLIRAYRAGELDVLSSCAVLTEGFDAPRAKVAVLARSCGSQLTYLQIVGRVLRPDGTGTALLLDLVGAVHEHGWPTEDRQYSLAGEAIRRASEAEVTIWQCPACGHCQSAAPARRRCPRCGSTMPEPEPLRIARERLERQARNERATPEQQAEALRWLVVRERQAGRSPYRAVHIFRARYHREPTREERASAGI